MCKTGLDPVWMVWSDFDQTHLVWLLPVSHFQTQLYSSTDNPDYTVQSQHGSDLVRTDCVRFRPNGSSPEACQCARMIRAASGRCFQADPDQMRIESGMFTGSIYIIFEERDRQTDRQRDRQRDRVKQTMV